MIKLLNSFINYFDVKIKEKFKFPKTITVNEETFKKTSDLKDKQIIRKGLYLFKSVIKERCKIDEAIL